MASPIFDGGNYKNLTEAGGGGVVSAKPCDLVGFYVNSTNAGTVILRDGVVVGATAKSGTITPAIGFHRFPGQFKNGLYAEIGGTALNVTFLFSRSA